MPPPPGFFFRAKFAGRSVGRLIGLRRMRCCGKDTAGSLLDNSCRLCWFFRICCAGSCRGGAVGFGHPLATKRRGVQPLFPPKSTWMGSLAYNSAV